MLPSRDEILTTRGIDAILGKDSFLGIMENRPMPDWSPRSESKAAACRRLQREGRYEVFQERKRKVLNVWRAETEYRGQDKRHLTQEQKDEVFYRALADFPPLPPDELPPPVMVTPDPETVIERELAALAEKTEGRPFDLAEDVNWALSCLHVKGIRPRHAPNSRAYAFWLAAQKAQWPLIKLYIKLHSPPKRRSRRRRSRR